MRPMFLVLMAGLVTGCGASPFFQTGDRVEGELTSDGGETGSLFVTLTLNRHRGELSPPVPVPFSLGMGKAWPTGTVEFLDVHGQILGESRTVNFEDAC